MTELRDADEAVGQPSESGDFEWVIEPDERELVGVHAAVRRWLGPSSVGRTAREDIELVVTEAAAMVLSASDRRRPVEIRGRHTHSVAVIEVTQVGEAPERADSSDLSGADAFRESLLRLLTARFTVAAAPNRMTVRCSISLVVDPDGPSLGGEGRG